MQLNLFDPLFLASRPSLLSLSLPPHPLFHISNPTPCLCTRIFDWLEDKKGNKKHKTPAKQYINTALEQIQKILQDEEQFPTKFGMLMGMHIHVCTFICV